VLQVDVVQGIELLATLTGLFSVWLARRAHVALYPIGFVSTILLVGLSYRQSLYAHAGINIWYSVMGLYGWWRWSTAPKENGIGRATARAWGYTLTLMGAAWVVFTYLPVWMGIPSLNRLDVVSSTIAVGAMYLMSARHTEHWLLWVVANSLFAYLFYSTGYHLIAGQYLLFILMAIWGWHSWVHKEKT
jgi:nicotinamide mononucleotide transporter